MSTPKQPAVPSTITSASGKRRWKLFAKYLTGTPGWEDHDVVVLERMVLNIEEAEAALKTASKSPVVVGSTGQDVAHPLWAVAARCDQVALAAARALGLTAAVRSHADADQDPNADSPEAQAFAEVDQLAAKRAERRSS